MGGFPAWRPSRATSVDEFRHLIANSGSRLVDSREAASDPAFAKVRSEIYMWLSSYMVMKLAMDLDFWRSSNGKCFAIAYARVEDVGRLSVTVSEMNNKYWHVAMVYLLNAPSLAVYRMVDKHIWNL
jgi:hypothetical protein